MRKNILIGIGILVYLFIFLVTVHADSEQQYQVDSETLTLRNAPDQDADKIATLQNGEKVTVFEESDGWGKTYYDNKPAWAETSKLTDINDKSTEQNQENDASDESVESGKLYQVKAPALRLRGAPDENAAIITELDNGVEVTIFEEADGWGKTYYNGKEGWIALSFLEKSDESADSSTLEVNEDEADRSDQETDEGEEDQSDQEKKGKEEEQSHQDADKNEENDSHREAEEKEDDDSQREIKGNEEDDSSQEAEENKEDDSTEEVEEDEEDQTRQEAGENDKEKSETESDQQDDESASENENKEKNKMEDDKAKQNEEQPLSGYHFVIDPGHGGKDTGTIGSDVDEKALTLSSAKKMEEQLEQKGASVTLTRTDDAFIPLGERVQMSNDDDTDAFVSVHYNASEDPSVHGIQTFHYYNENQELANSVSESLTQEVDLSDRGTDQADYEVLRDNEQPALLIELGFISNPEELETIQTDDFQDKAAEGVAGGLEDYFK